MKPAALDERKPNTEANMSHLTPADRAENFTNKERAFMDGLLDEFKKFVDDSMVEGHHDNFEDHLDFLKASMETWVTILTDANS